MTTASFIRVATSGPGEASVSFAGLESATVRILRPFSWDAKHRGLTIETIDLDRPRTLVCGPYAAADAAWRNHSPDVTFAFPADDGSDMAWYRAAGEPATASDRVQDAAGWCTIEAESPAGPVAIALALGDSSTVLVELSAGPDGVGITARHSSGGGEAPELLVRSGPGSHDDAEGWLRELLIEAMPADRLGPPPLMADTWGFETDIDPDRVARFFDAAADLGLEVVTIDKGWERAVGDWEARPEYPGGVAGLAAAAHERGMRLGLWVAAGNADPASRVATEHPDWLATWHGAPLLLSHRTHLVCLGHEPAAASVLAQLESLVEAGMYWLLHDFETIARCDASHHTHESEAGERAAAAGWYRILSVLRERHPQLVIENCWNGGRPLDLAVVRHHDTTIGDDWCRSGTNITAKLGLGRYLPSSWCTAYMGDEPELPVSAWLAPYIVGGPWIVMGDLAEWSDERRSAVRRALDIAKAWRSADRRDRVVPPALSAPMTALATTPRADGSQLAVFVISDADVGRDVRWLVGAGDLVDEWTGARRAVTADEVAVGITIDTTTPGALVFSVRPSGDGSR